VQGGGEGGEECGRVTRERSVAYEKFERQKQEAVVRELAARFGLRVTVAPADENEEMSAIQSPKHPGPKQPGVSGTAPAVPGAAAAVPGSVPAVLEPMPGTAPAVPGAAPALPGAAPAVPGSVPTVLEPMQPAVPGPLPVSVLASIESGHATAGVSAEPGTVAQVAGPRPSPSPSPAVEPGRRDGDRVEDLSRSGSTS